MSDLKGNAMTEHLKALGVTSQTFRSIQLTQIGSADRIPRGDVAAVEAPLEVRVNGSPFAVIMRTPGSDVELVAGFLLSEGLVSPGDLGAGPDPMRVRLAPDGAGVEVALPLDRASAGGRRVVTNSSCGVCGHVSLDTLVTDVARVVGSWTIDRAAISALPVRLREAQVVFERTGGLHAAGLFDRAGRLEEIAEDVGRHNAVDKIMGRMLFRRAMPLDAHVLCVSGRTSFEIVQKAALGGVPIVAAVSAPSTLAIDMADRAGMTLVGFVRDHTFNVYTHEERIA